MMADLSEKLAEYSALAAFSKEGGEAYLNSLPGTEKVAIMNFLRAAGAGVGQAFRNRSALQGASRFARGAEMGGHAALAQSARAGAASLPGMRAGFQQGFQGARAAQGSQMMANGMSQAANAMHGAGTATTAAAGAQRPGMFRRALGWGGTALGVASMGQAAYQGMQRQASYNPSLAKYALNLGLQDAIDLGSYGLLMAGPATEIAAPEFAEEHRNALLGADLAGLALLTRHHIPGLKPEGH